MQIVLSAEDLKDLLKEKFDINSIKVIAGDVIIDGKIKDKPLKAPEQNRLPFQEFQWVGPPPVITNPVPQEPYEGNYTIRYSGNTGDPLPPIPENINTVFASMDKTMSQMETLFNDK